VFSNPVNSCDAPQPTRDVVFVTALYDIGRGQWQRFRRSFELYLSSFRNLLDLNVKLIVYANETVVNFVLDRRQHLRNKTWTVVLSFSELEYFEYRQHIQHILSSAEFRDSNKMLDHPEAFSVEYLILMNNKVSFLANAVRTNPFNTTHFFWIDAGYGNGADLSRLAKFRPGVLLNKDNKITYFELNDPQSYRDINHLHKVRIEPAFCGNFFAGDAKAILKYERLYKKTFRRLLTEFVVDDDQNVAYHCYKENPRLFENIRGSWLDAMKLFS
jgi:protein YibB